MDYNLRTDSVYCLKVPSGLSTALICEISAAFGSLVDGLFYEVKGVSAVNSEDAFNFRHFVDFQDFSYNEFGDSGGVLCVSIWETFNMFDFLLPSTTPLKHQNPSDRHLTKFRITFIKIPPKCFICKMFKSVLGIGKCFDREAPVC